MKKNITKKLIAAAIAFVCMYRVSYGQVAIGLFFDGIGIK